LKPENKIIVALDKSSLAETEKLIKKLTGKITFYKIGSELFTSEGPRAVRLVKEYGGKLFLDLKFHDIPNTVYRAVRAATKLGVDMLNFHAAGGLEMMQAAVKAAQQTSAPKPTLLAVTILTSLNDLALKNELRFRHTVSEQVLHLAQMAHRAGADGVVASPHEIRPIRDHIGEDIIIVTPGVRPVWAQTGDQKRTMTPREAIQQGADYIVVGRPITAASDPASAVDKIIDEIS